jgi:hypothetical protein
MLLFVWCAGIVATVATYPLMTVREAAQCGCRGVAAPASAHFEPGGWLRHELRQNAYTYLL